MAAYKALVSFSGAVSMAAGQVRELIDNAVIEDLLRAGYIEEFNAAAKKTTAKKTTKRKGKTDEN